MTQHLRSTPIYFLCTPKSLASGSLHPPPLEQSKAGVGRGPSAQAHGLAHVGPRFLVTAKLKDAVSSKSCGSGLPGRVPPASVAPCTTTAFALLTNPRWWTVSPSQQKKRKSTPDATSLFTAPAPHPEPLSLCLHLFRAFTAEAAAEIFSAPGLRVPGVPVHWAPPRPPPASTLHGPFGVALACTPPPTAPHSGASGQQCLKSFISSDFQGHWQFGAQSPVPARTPAPHS